MASCLYVLKCVACVTNKNIYCKNNIFIKVLTIGICMALLLSVTEYITLLYINEQKKCGRHFACIIYMYGVTYTFIYGFERPQKTLSAVIII